MKGKKTQVLPGKGRTLLKSHIHLSKMLHIALAERGIKQAIHCQHRQKVMEQGLDKHLAESSTKNTQTHTGSKGKDMGGLQRKTQ